ncbi:hypothetical protein [Aquamicrobium sp.]|uniref:hypothetical protein n=1 Tax=Aquamicrobium sp. TaxID=1872579 RepID=UPI00258ADEED|nr:hypothetical protein [Aquamicrobium sp.]MCK9550434.1 hypothetical protein [Aquamicrobium sp.]
MFKKITIIAIVGIFFAGCATPSFNVSNTAYLTADFMQQTKFLHPIGTSRIYIKPDTPYKKQLSDAMRKAGYEIENDSSKANVQIDLKVSRIEKDLYSFLYVVNNQMLSRAYMINRSTAPATNWSKTIIGGAR